MLSLSVCTELHEPDTAFLNEPAVAGDDTACFNGCMRSSERRVASKWQLAARSENTEPVVGLRPARRQQERRLRQVRPGCHSLHRLRIQALRIENDSNRIAPKRGRGEDVDNLVGAFLHYSRLILL